MVLFAVLVDEYIQRFHHLDCLATLFVVIAIFYDGPRFDYFYLMSFRPLALFLAKAVSLGTLHLLFLSLLGNIIKLSFEILRSYKGIVLIWGHMVLGRVICTLLSRNMEERRLAIKHVGIVVNEVHRWMLRYYFLRDILLECGLHEHLSQPCYLSLIILLKVVVFHLFLYLLLALS